MLIPVSPRKTLWARAFLDQTHRAANICRQPKKNSHFYVMHIYHIFAQSWFRLVLSSSILVGTSILLSFSWTEISLIIMIRPPVTHPRRHPVQEHVGRRNRILHRYETSQVTEKIWSMVIDTAISLNQNNNPIQSTRITVNTSLAAKGALAHRLQRRTACKIQNGCQGAPKWRTGSGKVSTSRCLGILSNFC